MREIFQQIFNLSVAGSYLILAVMAVRLLLRKAPKGMVCFLWIMVGVRLVLPVPIESSFGILPVRDVLVDSSDKEGMMVVDTGFEEIDRQANRQIRKNYGVWESAVNFSFFDLCGWFWLAGMILLSGYFFQGWWKLRKKVCTAVPEEWGEEKIYLCDEIDTPFLMGLIHPRIYLPAGMDREAIPYVVAHERSHKDRKDHLAKWTASLFLIVYWFHPLVWVSYILFSRDMEFACDERVIRQMGTEHKKSYSNALLSCCVGRRATLWCPVAFGEVGVKSRIVRVLHYRKPAFWMAAAAAGLILLTAACFLTQRKEVPREGSVLTYGGCEFILKEAIACKETDFMKLVFNIRSDGTASGALEREYAGLVCGGMTGRVKSTDVVKDEIRITQLGIYNQAVNDALTLWLGSSGTSIGTFSPNLVEYEQAEEYLLDSAIGKIRVWVSPQSMKVICDDGVPGKKEGGILAMEMKNGERWKVTRIPLRTGAPDSGIEFDGELYYYTGGMDEENGCLFFSFQEPIKLEDIQSFAFFPES